MYIYASICVLQDAYEFKMDSGRVEDICGVLFTVDSVFVLLEGQNITLTLLIVG